MPYTGFDPPEHGTIPDMSGGGMDPSYAWSLAPGGRFAGDDWSAQEVLIALGLDPATFQARHGAQEGYEVPGPVDDRRGLGGIAGILSALLRGHEWNVQNTGGVSGGNAHLGLGDNHFFSGPGAPYGPYSGPTRGLADQGVPPDRINDFPEWRPPGESGFGTPPAPRRGGGGGGGYNGAGGIPAYQGLQSTPQFLAWQPADLWAGQQPNPRPAFTGGGGSSLGGRPVVVVAPPPRGG